MRPQLGKPAIHHHLFLPGCSRFERTPGACMEFGLGQDGRFDCSGLVIDGMRKMLGLPGWAPEFRHTRQMVKALLAAGERPDTLDNVVRRRDEAAIGSLVFSHRQREAGGEIIWSIAHVSVLTDYADDGRPLFLQAQAGYEGKVVERPPYDLPQDTPERLVFNSAALAGLAIAHSPEIVPIKRVGC